MKLKTLFATFALGTLLTMTSCLNDGDNEITSTLTFNDYFNTVSDIATGNTSVMPIVKYKVVLKQNSERLTAVISMSNFALEDLKNYDFVLPELAVSEKSDGTMVIEADGIKPKSGTETDYITFDRVEFKILQLSFKSTEGTTVLRTIMSARFKVNGKWQVNAVPKEAICFAKTESVNDETGSKYTDNEALYTITFNYLTGLADIDIEGAKFMEKMPAMNMKFPKVPFTASASGVVLHADEVVPTIGDVPYPQYAITDIDCVFNALATNTLTFKCNPGGMGNFSINALICENPVVFNESK